MAQLWGSDSLHAKKAGLPADDRRSAAPVVVASAGDAGGQRAIAVAGAAVAVLVGVAILVAADRRVVAVVGAIVAALIEVADEVEADRTSRAVGRGAGERG